MKNYMCFLVLVFITGCANIVPPSGGEKDTTAPRLTKTSPANYAINFKDKRITIWFDEYIQLNNLNNIQISPTCEPMPIFSVTGKKIDIKMECNLMANVTYTINFGKSIADINEGNILSNFKYTFSTGKSIDSLYIKGNISNLYFDDPVDGALVGLSNSNNIDSLNPYYYNYSNASGDFILENIKEDNYVLFAFFDENNNLQYDPGELTSFPKYISKFDTTKNIKLFKDLEPFKDPDVTNNSTNSIYFKNLNPKESISILNTEGYWNKSKEKAVFWFKNKVPWIYYKYGENIDSIQIYSVDSVPKININLKSEVYNIAKDKQVILESNIPIDSINPEGFIFNSKTLTSPPEILSPFKLLINLDSLLKESNNLIVHQGAIISLIESHNDSTMFNIDLKKENYGSINILSKNAPQNTVVELFKNDIVVRRCHLLDTTKIFWVQPGEYRLRSFIDKNHNNSWDSGQIKANKAPEKIKVYKETISIRRNWEIDLTISPPEIDIYK